MRLWTILPDETLTDDRAYLVGFLKGCFDTVWVTRAARTAADCTDPPGRPDVILNLVSSRSPELLAALDRRAAEWGVPISPPSRGSWRTEDKRTYLEDFPDVSPPSRIVRSVSELEAVRGAFGGDVVIKDPFGDRGKGVERIRGAEDLESAEALLQSTIRATGELVVQPYFSGFAKGDKRVVLQRMPDNSFEIVAYIGRVPPDGGWKSNIRSGGRSVRTDLTNDERAFALALAPRAGIDNVGLDIAEHDGRLWYIEHNQGYGGIIDFDLERNSCNVRRTAEFLIHIARHGRPELREEMHFARKA
jgi:glutathione synthase/RimK-type ligase-like ATP-grasp enzyme